MAALSDEMARILEKAGEGLKALENEVIRPSSIRTIQRVSKQPSPTSKQSPTPKSRAFKATVLSRKQRTRSKRNAGTYTSTGYRPQPVSAFFYFGCSFRCSIASRTASGCRRLQGLRTLVVPVPYVRRSRRSSSSSIMLLARLRTKSSVKSGLTKKYANALDRSMRGSALLILALSESRNLV
ncbi:hypothetical protein AWB64_05286 [Caballeronia sordidicola]|uniref:Uncharacterized protein n=1 Tax=Caballeronia sordidicola TaxID=196367 RepID=A0A158I0M4_CABSO|nr:hypothetical protein AWB64_05286 [Caballeronia sordidicola]